MTSISPCQVGFSSRAVMSLGKNLARAMIDDHRTEGQLRDEPGLRNRQRA